MSRLLEVKDLCVQYPGTRAAAPVRAVDGMSFSMERGRTYALVGESGCGKSATALALMRLVEPGVITGGEILFEGNDLLKCTERQMRAVRGARIGMVFQEAAAALNPVMRIGAQVSEPLRIHRKLSRARAWEEAVRLLAMVALPDPAAQAKAYPHELSGGMKQRVMLAIGLACSPTLLIADEPTTALDVTIQAQILALLRSLRSQLELTVLLITHDLGVVAENADRVGVMYSGRLVEEAQVGELLEDPKHPYTRGLLTAQPRGLAGGGDRRLPTIPGAVPDPSEPPTGCRFHPRCPEAFDLCPSQVPADSALDGDRRVSCFLHEEPFKSYMAGMAPGDA
jgi:peptide/nickel transport system ATP-binding protein/oligopeptide transport system ATP-binding protein